MGDRRRRQSAEKQRKQAKANLSKVIGEGDRKINEAERNEIRAEKHLDKMRMGFSQGAKLYYDMYQTLATLTTSSILVIVALSRGILLSNQDYSFLLWFAYLGLLLSMLASLISMELITSGVFVTLTKEAEDIERFSDATDNRLKRRTRISGWSFALGIYAFVLFVVLPTLVPLLGWQVFALFVVLPLSAWVLLRKWL